MHDLSGYQIAAPSAELETRSTATQHNPIDCPLPRPGGVLALSAMTLAALLFLVAPGFAQDRYLAFGDSITEGFGFDDDCTEDCGYPRRLRNRLAADGNPVPVENHGLGGEDTTQGLTRLDTVLSDTGAGVGDVLLLMEGTNDITRGISPETTIANLDQMALKALVQGVTTIHATLIPRYPDATVDPENELNQALIRDIRDLAFNRSRGLVDPTEVFSQTLDVFETYYAMPDFFDPVGHPNSDGFGLLADTFFRALTGRDNLPPVITQVEPADGSAGVSPLTPLRVRIYDFGTGIDPTRAGLTLNGTSVQVDVSTGGQTWLDVVYRPLDPLPDSVVMRVQGGDLANPSNTMNRRVSTFTVDSTAPDPCVPSPTTLCLDDTFGDRRFRVRMTWQTAMNGGQSGQAFVTGLAAVDLDSGGLLSFFEGTPEVLIKVLDGCNLTGHFWIFGAPTTTLGYELIVEDTLAKSQGAPESAYKYVVTNADGNVAGPFADVEALDTCSFSP